MVCGRDHDMCSVGGLKWFLLLLHPVLFFDFVGRCYLGVFCAWMIVDDFMVRCTSRWALECPIIFLIPFCSHGVRVHIFVLEPGRLDCKRYHGSSLWGEGLFCSYFVGAFIPILPVECDVGSRLSGAPRICSGLTSSHVIYAGVSWYHSSFHLILVSVVCGMICRWWLWYGSVWGHLFSVDSWSCWELFLPADILFYLSWLMSCACIGSFWDGTSSVTIELSAWEVISWDLISLLRRYQNIAWYVTVF